MQLKPKSNYYGGVQHPPINVNDDTLMVSAGLRPPLAQSVSFEKTEKERNDWRKEHTKHYDADFKRTITGAIIPKKNKVKPLLFKDIIPGTVKGQLVIHLINKPLGEGKKGSNIFPTTQSAICYFNEISNVILNVKRLDPKDIKDVYFNSHKVLNYKS